MKSMKKLLAIALVLVMLTAIGATVFAADGDAETVTITVKQDGSYQGEDGQAGRTYTAYKVFDASYASNTSTGGGVAGKDSTDPAPGTPSAVTGTAEGVSYTANATIAAKLGSWNAETKTWTKATGNLWFKLTPIAGSTNYVVTWDNSDTSSAAAQAAAQWLYANGVYDATGTTLAWDSTNKQWSATVTKGYYLIHGDTGANLVAATTDININEKNDYPPVDKKQADKDIQDLDDNKRSVQVGETLNYSVEVYVPNTAVAGQTIIVYDTPSTGLQYNNDITVSPSGAATAGTPESGEIWRQVITVTDALKGQTVKFSFTMTVTADALDNVKENDAGLIYNNYNSKPDKVEYETYFGGIKKQNKANESLAGVEFTLEATPKNGTAAEVKVVLVTPTDTSIKPYYVPSSADGASSTVVTDAEGMIRIRGLDKDMTYTLTETKTLDGYNMLAGPVTLTLYVDTVTVTTADGTTTKTYSYNQATTDNWSTVINEQGTLLPSTGGIGTTLFYVFGTLLVLAAGVVLVTKRRVRE